MELFRQICSAVQQAGRQDPPCESGPAPRGPRPADRVRGGDEQARRCEGLEGRAGEMARQAAEARDREEMSPSARERVPGRLSGPDFQHDLALHVPCSLRAWASRGRSQRKVWPITGLSRPSPARRPRKARSGSSWRTHRNFARRGGRRLRRPIARRREQRARVGKGRDVGAARIEQSPACGERAPGDRVEDDVVTLQAARRSPRASSR